MHSSILLSSETALQGSITSVTPGLGESALAVIRRDAGKQSGVS